MTHALIISTTGDGVQDDMIAPLLAQRAALRRELGVRLRSTKVDALEAIAPALKTGPVDVAFIATSWRNTAVETESCFRSLAALRNRPRIVYFDSFDATSSPYFSILPHVDCYVKKQLLCDLDRYNDDLAGGYIFTDHLHRKLGWDLDGWTFGSKIPEGCADRLMLGWNLGAVPKLERTLRRRGVERWRPMPPKTIDAICRVALRPGEERNWYTRHRLEAIRALGEIDSRWRVIAHGGLIGSPELAPPRQYAREMRQSRLALSPFGWGEVCYRDFEAVCCDALLVKPSMAHLRTRPDIFLDDVTYVPVKWDLSDVAHRCAYFLERPDDAAKIISAARSAYLRFFEDDGIITAVRDILERAFCDQPTSVASVETAALRLSA